MYIILANCHVLFELTDKLALLVGLSPTHLTQSIFSQSILLRPPSQDGLTPPKSRIGRKLQNS